MSTISAKANGFTVALTGATGFVGRHVVKAMIDQGWRVKALVRSAHKAFEVLGASRELAAKNIELVVGDAADPAAARQLVRGTDVCVNLVGIIREVRGQTRRDLPQTFERMHVQVARVLTEACKDAGVKRFVQMSALGVGPEGRSEYQRSKWEAEQIVRQSGLEWTIMRPSLIHGPGSEFVEMMKEIGSGNKPPYFFLPYFVRQEFDSRLPWPLGPNRYVPAKVQPIHVDDVALAFVRAIERREAVGEIYNLGGKDEMNWQEATIALRDNVPGMRKSMGTWYIPGEHAAKIARVMEKLGMGSLLPFDEGQALMATQDNAADGRKAEADLGIKPRGFVEGIREYARS